jgi:hypothetical protein
MAPKKRNSSPAAARSSRAAKRGPGQAHGQSEQSVADPPVGGGYSADADADVDSKTGRDRDRDRHQSRRAKGNTPTKRSRSAVSASASASASASVSAPTLQACARALDALWTTAHVGLSLSVLNVLVASFVASQKPVAPLVRPLPFRPQLMPGPFVFGSELWWVEEDTLCSTPLPVAASDPVVRRRVPRANMSVVRCWLDPSVPDRVLVLPYFDAEAPLSTT